MKKERAIVVFGVLAIALAGYVTWTCWPRSAVVEWHYRISEDERILTEDYLSQHPPKQAQFSWARLWISVTSPYDLPRDTVVITKMKYSDGNELIQINYPERTVSIRCLKTGTWEEVDPLKLTSDNAVPYIGRMFEKREK